MESVTSKNLETSGEALPALELLADMQLETGNWAEALVNYQLALARSPNRFNSLRGALKAVRSLDLDVEAEKCQIALAELTKDGTSKMVMPYQPNI